MDKDSIESSIKSKWGSFKKNLPGYVSLVKRKTEDYSRIGKDTLDIKFLENKLSKLLVSVGESVYTNKTKPEYKKIALLLKTKISSIEKVKREIESLKNDITSIKTPKSTTKNKSKTAASAKKPTAAKKKPAAKKTAKPKKKAAVKK